MSDSNRIQALVKDARAWAGIGSTPGRFVTDEARQWYASHPLNEIASGLPLFGDGGLDVGALTRWLQSGPHPMPEVDTTPDVGDEERS